MEQRLAELPAVPPGDYAVLQLHTVFGGVRAAVETVTLEREPERGWRVVGSFIR